MRGWFRINTFGALDYTDDNYFVNQDSLVLAGGADPPWTQVDRVTEDKVA